MNLMMMDKVADMAKEFNVRVRENEKSIYGVFEKLGIQKPVFDQALEYNEHLQLFGSALINLQEIEDEKERDSYGLALFGTNWEEL